MRELTSYTFTQALKTREAYAALGDDLNSWTQGGCWVLAEAIKKWVGPRCAIYVVRGRQWQSCSGPKGSGAGGWGPVQPHHVVARIGDYLDADGIDRGPERVINTWTHTEWLHDVSVKTFLPRYRKAALKEGLICPPAAVKRVARFLEKTFGPGEKATAWMNGEEVRPNPRYVPICTPCGHPLHTSPIT